MVYKTYAITCTEEIEGQQDIFLHRPKISTSFILVY